MLYVLERLLRLYMYRKNEQLVMTGAICSRSYSHQWIYLLPSMGCLQDNRYVLERGVGTGSERGHAQRFGQAHCLFTYSTTKQLFYTYFVAVK